MFKEFENLIDSYKNRLETKDATIKVIKDHLDLQDQMMVSLTAEVKKLQEENSFLVRKLEKYTAIEETLQIQQDELFKTAVFPNVV